jgi:hypothetical protein
LLSAAKKSRQPASSEKIQRLPVQAELFEGDEIRSIFAQLCYVSVDLSLRIRILKLWIVNYGARGY